MAEIWEQNEEIDEEEELVATNHRDDVEPLIEGEDEQEIETTHETPRAAMDELGEDASSSPARRGHDDPEAAAAEAAGGEGSPEP
ncbi:MAG: hypothetical protein ACTIJJ_08765 [Galactobacter sp.]|uniref:hypothetical protein n=1 Tax=Galactobacter sp. TaxID=2676125 RepID=UPI0025B87AF2|nr:hypothetical protein [Galactobacter sp.]